MCTSWTSCSLIGWRFVCSGFASNTEHGLLSCVQSRFHVSRSRSRAAVMTALLQPILWGLAVLVAYRVRASSQERVSLQAPEARVDRAALLERDRVSQVAVVASRVEAWVLQARARRDAQALRVMTMQASLALADRAAVLQARVQVPAVQRQVRVAVERPARAQDREEARVARVAPAVAAAQQALALDAAASR
jgi:hypothetical protein